MRFAGQSWMDAPAGSTKNAETVCLLAVGSSGLPNLGEKIFDVLHGVGVPAFGLGHEL